MEFLIVDDEAKHRKGMANLLQKLYPVANVQIAKDGEEALNIVRSDRPDVILTDIRMPKLDGLTFLKILTEEMIPSKVVMLSAYNLFEYAQQALRYGAFDYLLKPVDTDKVKDVLSRIEAHLIAEEMQRKKVNELRQRLDVASTAYLQNLIISWLTGRINLEERHELESLGIANGEGVIVYSEISYLSNVEQAVEGSILKEIESTLSNLGKAQIFPLPSLRRGKSRAVTIVSLDGTVPAVQQEIRGKLSKLQTRSQSSIRITHGIGPTCDSLLEEAVASYQLAEQAWVYTFYEFREGVVISDEISPTNQQLQLDGEQLVQKLQKYSIHDAIVMCRQAFENIASCGNVHPDHIKQYAALTIMKMKSRLRNIIDQSSASMLTEAANTQVVLCNTYAELMSLIERCLHQVYDALNQDKQKKTEVVIGKFLEWIQERYMEDITLEMAGMYCSFNPSYLSTLIKNQTGLSFSDHLLQVRMSRARDLLSEHHLKVYEIAERCGYRDTKYFCRMFKKQHAVSPESYRRISTFKQKK
jgi:two-component system response regulator YesN